MWRSRKTPVSFSKGVEDVLVPAGTHADMSDLDYLSVYNEWTWAQLYEMTQGPAVDPGWNKPYIEKLLTSLHKQPLQPLYQGNRWLFPEKIAEDVKENASAWSGSALARLLVWDFYFRDGKTGRWNRRVLLDYNNLSPEGLRSDFSPERQAPDFLYTKDGYADDWSQMIHWFTGNCSNVAPFRYYSIRSVGYLLYGVCLYQNRLRCKLADHVEQQLLNIFRNVSEDDRERLENWILHNMGVLPDGVSFLGANDRHTADWGLIEGALNQNRQLMAESATSFLPDIAVEGDKPAMTATESLIRNQASVTLTSAVLNQLYEQSEPFYREILRRFFADKNDDPMVKRVRERLREDGVPDELLNIEFWDVVPNRVMGGGNKAVELTTARSLFEIAPRLAQVNPDALRLTSKDLVLALTDDAQKADLLVPDDPNTVDNSSAVAAASAFGTLMEGVPYPSPKGLNQVQYIGTLMQLMAEAMKPLEAMVSQPQMISAAAEKIAGLVNTGAHVQEHIQLLAMDETFKQEAAEAQRTLQQLMLELKGYGERLSEAEQAAAQQQGGLSPEAQGKIIEMQTLAQAKAQIMQQQAAIKQQAMATKEQRRDIDFAAEQERKTASTAAEIQRKAVQTQADIEAQDLKTRADLLHQAEQAKADRENKTRKAASE